MPEKRLACTRREWLAAALGALRPARAAGPARNVLFILADDLGWIDLGAYGADLHETPNLDKLAAASVRFTDAYAASPVCTPTRASIMTGKHPARLGMTFWRESAATPPDNRPAVPPAVRQDLPLEEVTLAERFRDAGYLTAHIGKWHLGAASHYPEAHGFDINVGGTHWGAPQTYFYPYRGNRHYGGEFRYVPGLPWGKEGEYLTSRLTDEALRVVERAGNRPFFLNLWYHTVHTPIEAEEDRAAYYRARLRPGMKHQNATYAAMVESLDRNVGRLLQALQERGLAERTAVVFMADNGGYVNAYRGQQVTNNAPLRSGKGSLYEGGIRVPLTIRWPGVTRTGAVCREPVCSTDLFKTALEMAGLTGDSGIDGESLAPLLRDPSAASGRAALYFHYPHYYPTTSPVSAIRAGRWKLLEYLEDGKLELYDLHTDLGETRDLAAEQPERARALRGQLDNWRRSVRAPMPQPNARYRKGGG